MFISVLMIIHFRQLNDAGDSNSTVLGLDELLTWLCILSSLLLCTVHLIFRWSRYVAPPIVYTHSLLPTHSTDKWVYIYTQILARDSIYRARYIVRPPVCPSQGWIGQKRLKLELCNFHRTQ